MEKQERIELERRLEQSRRLGAWAIDALTQERLDKLVHELERQLDQRAQPFPRAARQRRPGDYVGHK